MGYKLNLGVILRVKPYTITSEKTNLQEIMFHARKYILLAFAYKIFEKIFMWVGILGYKMSFCKYLGSTVLISPTPVSFNVLEF